MAGIGQTVWTKESTGEVVVTPSPLPTWHDVRDGDGRLLGALHNPGRARWWLHATDADVARDLAATDLPVGGMGGRGFRSGRAVVDWFTQRRSTS